MSFPVAFLGISIQEQFVKCLLNLCFFCEYCIIIARISLHHRY